MNVLLVEDDHGIVVALKRFFRYFPKFNIHFANNVHEGEEMLRAHGFDAIVADMFLEPSGDGVALLEWAAQQQPGAMRILVSGVDAPRGFLCDERQHFLRKPFEPDTLVELLESSQA